MIILALLRGWCRFVVNVEAACHPSRLKSPQSKSMGNMEEEIIRKINNVRKEHGLMPLKGNNVLKQVARGHSCSQATQNQFSHEEASGSTPSDRVRKAGVRFTLLGENIAMVKNVDRPVDEIVKGWIKSKGHRENILDPPFTQTGVGIWQENGSFYATQLLLRP